MDFLEKIIEIEKSPIKVQDKVKKINSLKLDLTNELEAVDQNMSPEVEHELAQKLTIANETLERLKGREKVTNEEHMCNELNKEQIITDKPYLSPEVEVLKDFCESQKTNK